jgi:hypothetical protein
MFALWQAIDYSDREKKNRHKRQEDSSPNPNCPSLKSIQLTSNLYLDDQQINHELQFI